MKKCEICKKVIKDSEEYIITDTVIRTINPELKTISVSMMNGVFCCDCWNHDNNTIH